MEKCSRAVKEMLPQPCSRHFSFIAYTASYSAGLRRSHFVFCHLQNGDKDISRCHQSVMGLKLTAAPLRAVLLLSAKPAHPPHTHRAYRSLKQLFIMSHRPALTSLMTNVLPTG